MPVKKGRKKLKKRTVKVVLPKKQGNPSRKPGPASASRPTTTPEEQADRVPRKSQPLAEVSNRKNKLSKRGGRGRSTSGNNPNRIPSFPSATTVMKFHKLKRELLPILFAKLVLCQPDAREAILATLSDDQDSS